MTERLEVFRAEARASHAWLHALVEDVTQEQAMWRPPGRANSIAETYVHIVRNQDEDMNHGFLERQMLGETSWRGKTGLPESWSDWSPDPAVDWPALRSYGDAVGAWLIEVLDGLTEGHLDRIAQLTTPDRPQWFGVDV